MIRERQFRKRISFLFVALFASGVALPSVAWEAPPIDAVTKEMVTLSATIDGDRYDLEAQILTPPGAGPFPLAVVTHGSPRRASSRRKMTTHQYVPRAMEFARRGYVAAIVMRRGYGRSEGHWYEEYGECDFPYYDKAAFTTATIFPIFMLLCYIALLLYFRSVGGYRAVQIE